MYNSTASEWQNTNLGVSVTPTLTGASTTLQNQPYTFTVSNHATYDAPAYFVGLYDGSGNLIRNNNDFTDNGDGTITGNMIAPLATYELRVKCQDFGDLQSEVATKALTVQQLGGTFRYWRMTGMITPHVNNWTYIKDWRLYSGASGPSGNTSYPASMTAHNAPIPYLASASYEYSSNYQAFQAFDSTMGGGWWSIGSSAGAANWLQIDLGSSTLIRSFSYLPQTLYVPETMTILASNTGAFTGEETTIIALTGLDSNDANRQQIG
jgi:hypothetical protein